MLSRQEITSVITSRIMEAAKIIKDERLRRGWSQAKLGQEVGISQEAIQKIERGSTKKSKYFPKIGQILSIPLEQLDSSLSAYGEGTVNQALKEPHRTREKIPPQDETSAQNARLGAPIEGFTRVPLRGRGMGGKDGVLIFDTGEETEYVEAPAKLHGVPGAYAVYVVGDSMLDRYANGEIVFVHPRLPLSKGDYCVIQVSTDDEATVRAWVKRFVSFDDKVLKVEQLNPKKHLSFPAKTVRAVHKIVMGGSI